jgi:hypothetical protein
LAWPVPDFLPADCSASNPWASILLTPAVRATIPSQRALAWAHQAHADQELAQALGLWVRVPEVVLQVDCSRVLQLLDLRVVVPGGRLRVDWLRALLLLDLRARRRALGLVIGSPRERLVVTLPAVGLAVHRAD